MDYETICCSLKFYFDRQNINSVFANFKVQREIWNYMKSYFLFFLLRQTYWAFKLKIWAIWNLNIEGKAKKIFSKTKKWIGQQATVKNNPLMKLKTENYTNRAFTDRLTEKHKNWGPEIWSSVVSSPESPYLQSKP